MCSGCENHSGRCRGRAATLSVSHGRADDRSCTAHRRLLDRGGPDGAPPCPPGHQVGDRRCCRPRGRPACRRARADAPSPCPRAAPRARPGRPRGTRTACSRRSTWAPRPRPAGEHLLHTVSRGPAVERPPVRAGPSRTTASRPAPTAAGTCPRRLVHPAGNGDHAHAVLHLERRGVPRHRRVVPLQPRQRGAVGRPARVGDEVRPGDHDVLLPRGVEDDDLVDHVDRTTRPTGCVSRTTATRPSTGCTSPLAQRTDHPRATRGHRHRLGTGLDPPQPLVGPLDVPDDAVARPTTRHRRTRGPGCARWRPSAARRPACRRVEPHDLGPPALLGTQLGPVDGVAVEGHPLRVRAAWITRSAVTGVGQDPQGRRTASVMPRG